jgi:hypothetical protein
VIAAALLRALDSLNAGLLGLGGSRCLIGACATEAAVQPETKYAQLGRDRIAYQVVGQGPPDLVMTTASFGDIDVAWEDPGLALFYRTLAPPIRSRPIRCRRGSPMPRS